MHQPTTADENLQICSWSDYTMRQTKEHDNIITISWIGSTNDNNSSCCSIMNATAMMRRNPRLSFYLHL